MGSTESESSPDNASQEYINHDLLAPDFIERRPYQIELAEKAQKLNTLVCLPTGLGKTTVSLLVTVERLSNHDDDAKVLFLAPTKPLVNQHANFYRESLTIPDDEIVVFNGDVRPADREDIWKDAKVIISTPQVIENDLIGNRIDMRSVVHLTFDECHRGTGDYSYVYIADRYLQDADYPLITGMSASPGSTKNEVLNVCNNLGVENVEVKTEEDNDIQDYTYDTDVEWIRVQLPDDIQEISDNISGVVKDRTGKLKDLGISDSHTKNISQSDIDKMQSRVNGMMADDDSDGYKGASLLAELRKLNRAQLLAETQTVEALNRYFERQQEDAKTSSASKATQRLVKEPKLKESIHLAEEYDDKHPKMEKLRAKLAETVLLNDGDKMIVFTESRDTVEAIVDEISDKFDAERFVGQTDKDGSAGMSQTEQQEVLDRFHEGEFQVLVSTSVAEEGLDVPEVDLVLFYEPVPTPIRSIQRKGRTGRQDEGKVVVLMAENTRDEAYYWISQNKEDAMESELEELKSIEGDILEELGGEIDDAQKDLSSFIEDENTKEIEVPDADEVEDETTDKKDGVTVGNDGLSNDEVEIVVDQRELKSKIARGLSQKEDVHTRLETLDVGDYICSDRVGVERKDVSDFLDTLTGGDRSLFDQIGDLSQYYDRPVLIIEGDGLYTERNIHPNAIRGAISSLIIDYGVSVLRTEDEDDTTEMLYSLAKREQVEQDRTVSAHGDKSGRTLSEQQEYVVSSVAEVGTVTAQSLLTALGSVRGVMNADKETLKTADGVGDVTADRILDVINADYEE